MAAGAIWGTMDNTKFLVSEFEKLGEEFHVPQLIKNDHEELYPKLTS